MAPVNPQGHPAVGPRARDSGNSSNRPPPETDELAPAAPAMLAMGMLTGGGPAVGKLETVETVELNCQQ